MSSQFSSPFLIKSPLKAYVSTAGHFARMQDKISSATINALGPKTSNCKELRDNWHGGKMTDKAYADASKDCGKTKDESSKTEQEKGIEKFGQDSYISNKMEGIGDLATATLENELKNK